jgi:hypothetical protein
MVLGETVNGSGISVQMMRELPAMVVASELQVTIAQRPFEDA